jgi:hypothetical protein
MTGGRRKPSRAVTRKLCALAGCEARFTATRKDARYCSPACRQAALRARAKQDDLERLARQIEETKALYWQLVQQYAEARGISMAGVNSEMAQTVTADGEIWIRGKLAGWCKPHRPGWTAWGLEAAPPPFMPPTTYADENFGRSAVDAEARRRRRRPVSQVVTDGRDTP